MSGSVSTHVWTENPFLAGSFWQRKAHSFVQDKSGMCAKNVTEIAPGIAVIRIASGLDLKSLAIWASKCSKPIPNQSIFEKLRFLRMQPLEVL